MTSTWKMLSDCSGHGWFLWTSLKTWKIFVITVAYSRIANRKLHEHVFNMENFAFFLVQLPDGGRREDSLYGILAQEKWPKDTITGSFPKKQPDSLPVAAPCGLSAGRLSSFLRHQTRLQSRKLDTTVPNAVMSARQLSSHRTTHNNYSWNQSWDKRPWCGKPKCLLWVTFRRGLLPTLGFSPFPLTRHLPLPRVGICPTDLGIYWSLLGLFTCGLSYCVSKTSSVFSFFNQPG